MERSGFGAHVSPTERTVPTDPERTLASPRFDEKSVQSARQAVPLTLRARARSWPLAVIVTCVLAGLVGGMLGGVALMKYQAGGTNPEPEAERQRPPASDSTRPTDVQSNADVQTANQQTTNQQTTNQQAATQPAGDTRGAEQSQSQPQSQAPPVDEGDAGSHGEEAEAGPGTRTELRAALKGWLAATNARDVNGQMNFYAPSVDAFYLSRNASRESVRAEKARVFSQARAVEVTASDPDIRLARDGRTAVMRFRKRYQIDGRGGEVLQELRWRRTASGWRIVGERDLRVLQ
jgi:ketosteroid isomerase-like protein